MTHAHKTLIGEQTMQYYDCCQAAGDCITPNDCAMCAKKVVALLQSYESQLQRERQRLLEEEQRQQREQERREEAERERIRQEKRAAKVGGTQAGQTRHYQHLIFRRRGGRRPG